MTLSGLSASPSFLDSSFETACACATESWSEDRFDAAVGEAEQLEDAYESMQSQLGIIERFKAEHSGLDPLSYADDFLQGRMTEDDYDKVLPPSVAFLPDCRSLELVTMT